MGFLKGLVILIVVLALIIGIILLIISNWNNKFAKVEATDVKDIYGKKYPTKNGNINLYTYGSGDKTLVILPGLDSVAPGLEFKGLAKKLEGYKTIVVEPLGHGLSDNTKAPRTLENIVSEIHEALSQAEITKYVLIAHAEAGLYATSYVNQYADEVIALVAIDTYIPAQADNGYVDQSSTYKFNSFMTKSGILRVVTRKMSEDNLLIPGLSAYLKPEEIDIVKKLVYTKSANATIVDEAAHVLETMNSLKGVALNSDVPAAIYLSSASAKAYGYWEAEHKKLLEGVKKSACEIIPSGHYIHIDKPDELIERMTAFLAE